MGSETICCQVKSVAVKWTPTPFYTFDKGVTDTATLAHVALAAEHAVKAYFSDELRSAIHRIAEPVRKPVDYIDFSTKPNA